jgi:hypothetical protein
MRILNLIEGNTERLYHFTNFIGVVGMLRDGKIKLSKLAAQDKESNLTNNAFPGAGDKAYFLSTARNRSGEFLMNNFRLREIGVLLSIDGRRVARYGRVIPVSYDETLRGEQEDRIVSDHEFIPIDAVVSSVDVYVPRDLIQQFMANFTVLRSIQEKFPNVRFFDDKQKFIRGYGSIEIDLSVLGAK